MYTVKDFEDKKEFNLVSSDTEVLSILEMLGIADSFDFLFVKLDRSGADYEEVWGGYGIPFDSQEVEQIK